jgi:hypothetical protein
MFTGPHNIVKVDTLLPLVYPVAPVACALAPLFRILHWQSCRLSHASPGAVRF